LRRVFLLIDSRHGVKDSDLELMGMLDETAVTYQVVMTKVDKLKKGELEKVLDKTQKAIAKRPAAFPEIICTSSEKKRGLDELRAEIATMGNPELTTQFARDVVLLKQFGVRPVIVHGGGPQIGSMLQKLNIKSEFVDGLRVSDIETVGVGCN